MYSFPEMFRKAYESSPLSLAFYQYTDGGAVPVLASDGLCRNAGVPRGQVLDWLATGTFVRIHPDDVGMVSRISKDFLERRGPYDVVFRCRIGSGYELIHGFGGWQTMPDGTELAMIVYINMSDTVKEMIPVAENYDLFRRDLFYSDPLTGLPNFNYLHEFAGEKAKMIRSDGRTPHIVYSDVCSMQYYNNQYGVREGDELLRLVASTLRELFPKALLVRGADDHFMLLTGVDDRAEMCRRLDAANVSIKRSARGNTSGIRSGICPVSEGLDVMEALDHARHALKWIDNDMTRMTAYFSQAADDEYWRNRYIIENIDRALENGWIRVFYQGITRVETGKIAAFEALARWIDPARGTISPAEFIPVLQRYHLLYKLDLYMLEQVCREIPIRFENGLAPAPVSVNFSRQDFDNADIVGAMNALYEKYELSRYVGRDCFIVEITEQDVAVGTEGFLSQLRRIRENGFRLWLDDFGSGYSAINMFSQFRFDLVKYDMELLRHLDDNGGANRLILRELAYVARELGIHTLVEGVENEEQLAFIRTIDCELAQGFYFSRPESLDEILFRLQSTRRVKLCETREERDHYMRRWLEKTPPDAER